MRNLFITYFVASLLALTTLVGCGDEVSHYIQGPKGDQGVAGQDGQNGADAPPTGFTPVGLIDPCGDAPGVYDEVFIKMSNGTVIASFSQTAGGLNTRFVVLTPGTYQTTDGDNCVFTIDSTGALTYENHHN